MVSQGPVAQPRPKAPGSRWQGHPVRLPGSPQECGGWTQVVEGKRTNGFRAHSSCRPGEAWAWSLGSNHLHRGQFGPQAEFRRALEGLGQRSGSKGQFCPPSAPCTQAAGTEDPSLIPMLPTVAGLRASCPGQQDPARLVPASPAWARPSAPARGMRERRQTGSPWDGAPSLCPQ